MFPPAGGFGTWRTHAAAAADTLARCPPGLSVAAAATLSVNPVSALRLLRDFVTLEPGDVVLQNAANSAVGRAVTQLASHAGIRVACIVRDRPDFDALADELRRLGAAAVVRAGHERRDATLAALPPAKLALNAVGGASCAELARMLRVGGTMVTYGGMAKQPVTLPTGALIFRDITARGFWLTAWARAASPAERVRFPPRRR